MYCNQCGAIIEEGQSFCTRCGVKLATQQKSAQPEKKPGDKKTAVLAIALAAVLLLTVVIGGVIFAFFSGLFLSVPEKVMLAAANTFKTSSELGKSVECMGKILNDDFTMNVDCSVENVRISNGSIVNGDGRMQVTADIGFMGVKAKDCILDLDDDALRLSVPKVYDKTVAYYYNEEAEMLESMAGEQLESINEIIRTINTLSHKKRVALDKKAYADLLKWWKNLDFETQKGIRVKVGNKKQTGTLYSVEISGDDILDLIDISEDFTEENSNSEFEDILEQYNMSTEEYFDMARDSVKAYRDDSIVFGFYVCKGKIVCVEVVSSDEKTLLTFEFDKDDGTETYTCEVSDTGTINLEYDAENGEYTVSLVDNYDNEIEINGVFTANKKSGSFEIDKIKSKDYSADIEVVSKFETGAEFRKLPDDELNLNNTDILELAEIGEEIQDKFDFLF